MESVSLVECSTYSHGKQNLKSLIYFVIITFILKPRLKGVFSSIFIT